MINAGQNNPYSQYPTGYPPPPPGPYGGMYQQPPQLPPFQAYMPQFVSSPFSMPNWNVTVDGKDNGMLGKYLGYNFGGQTIKTASDTLSQVFQYALASDASQKQFDVIGKQYDLIVKAYDNQLVVSKEEIAFRNNVVSTQEKIHERQTEHEREIKKIEATAAKQIARIQEEGKTDRARLMVASDTFRSNRGMYGDGSPLLSELRGV